MKNTILIAAALSLLTLSAQAQSPARRARARALPEGTFVAPRVAAPGPEAIAPSAAPEGVVPRAIRSGNPLQMINPFAPAGYGSGQEVVRHEDGDPYQNPRGIKFVAYTF